MFYSFDTSRNAIDIKFPKAILISLIINYALIKKRFSGHELIKTIFWREYLRIGFYECLQVAIVIAHKIPVFSFQTFRCQEFFKRQPQNGKR